MHVHTYALWGTLALAAPLIGAQAQDSVRTLSAARDRALRASPDVAAAREAVAVARGQERQAGAFPNPILSYGREQTGNASQTAEQDIIAADQPIELPGLRSARRDAARARRLAAEARLAVVEADVAFAATRAYATAIASQRRARLADTVARAFAAAVTVSERRLREGDISGFAARRIRLESARYAALRADALLSQRTARVSLASLIGDPVPSGDSARLAELPALATPVPSADSLVAVALQARPDLSASTHEIEAARAEARRVSNERLPSLTLTAGGKSEEVPGTGRLNGFVAGIALPLPIWDRRGGAVVAANAETRRREAELSAVRRRVARDVLEAADALLAAQEQLQAVGPSVEADAAVALRAAQTAYTEGEVTLLEWLDTVRAYQETATTIANLRAEVVVRAAALERAVGAPIFPELR